MNKHDTTLQHDRDELRGGIQTVVITNTNKMADAYNSGAKSFDLMPLVDDIMQLFDTHVAAIERSVDRIEVIDETGRTYVKGSIYGTPVRVKLDYQDDGKTLKVFVEEVGKDENP